MSKIKDIRPEMSAPTISLGGKIRKIQFDLNAFGELENKYGTIQAAMDQLQKGGMNDVKVILWAGLIHEEVVLDEATGDVKGYNITPYQVGSWVSNPLMLQEISEKIGAAMGTAMPPQDAEDKKEIAEETPKVRKGHQMAKVVLTEEEKAEEAKNA